MSTRIEKTMYFHLQIGCIVGLMSWAQRNVSSVLVAFKQRECLTILKTSRRSRIWRRSSRMGRSPEFADSDAWCAVCDLVYIITIAEQFSALRINTQISCPCNSNWRPPISPPFKTINQFACKIFPRLPPFPLKRGGEGVQPPPRTSHAFTKWRRVRSHCDTYESYPYFDYLRWCSRRMLTILKIDMQRKLPNIRIYS